MSVKLRSVEMARRTSSAAWRVVRNRYESHPIITVFLIALIPRILTAFAIFIRRSGMLFPDDEKYLRLATEYAAGRTSTWDDYTRELWKESASFLAPVGWIFRIFGAHAILAQTLVAIVGSVTVVVVVMILRNLVSTSSQLFVAVLFSVFPSQVVWSSIFLKDTFSALSVVFLMLTLSRMPQRSGARNTLSTLVSFALPLIFLSRVRSHTLLCVSIALILSLLLSKPKRWLLLASTGALVVLVPWISLGDPASKSVLTRLSIDLEDQRIAGAVGADTAIVEPQKPSPTESEHNTEVADTSPTADQREPVIVDQRQGEPSFFSTLGRNLAYFPSGAKVMLFDPMPWNIDGNKKLMLALMEHLIWYPLVGLAVLGVFRRKTLRAHLIFAALSWGGLTLMWGQIEGNFGTAFRHRTEFVWAVFVFAGLGLDRLREIARAQRSVRRIQD